jgi:uncharacterized protein YdbL (DUF1318 family)
MKKSFICLLLLLVNFSYSAWGDVSDRMKARLSDVVAAKDAGTVGEGVDGYLHLRASSNSTAQKLVDAENADRKELFKKLSAKTGGDVSAVARQFSQSIASKAKSGHWFKKSSGTWVQK